MGIGIEEARYTIVHRCSGGAGMLEVSVGVNEKRLLPSMPLWWGGRGEDWQFCSKCGEALPQSLEGVEWTSS